MIRSFRLRLSLAIASCLLFRGVAALADPPSQVGRLSFASGPVSFRPGSLDVWTEAILNYPLTPGDHLWTDRNARAEVQVLYATIRSNAETDFSFLSLDDATVQIRLPEGSLYVNRRGFDQGSTFEIDTPNAVVSLPLIGKFRVDVLPNGETRVTVHLGEVEVTAGEYVIGLSAGQSTVVTGTGAVGYSGSADSLLDDWDAWCVERDNREDRVASAPHVPRDMIGADDLEGNGTWAAAKDYGAVWTPTRAPVGWAPYHFGHWSWVAPWGWTWIDDQPWGFVTSHYGRWASLNGAWIWLPGVAAVHPVYASALVVFVGGSGGGPSGSGSIGWFPLGPREIYIPPYQASDAYVSRINVAYVGNISASMIHDFNASRVAYANRGVGDGLTVVSRETFSQSRPTAGAAIALSAPEATRAPLMGMTATITPRRESIVARPQSSSASVPRPPVGLASRRVFSRVAPHSAPVPFAQQERALASNPGKPIDPSKVARPQRNIQAEAPVTVVDAATLARRKSPSSGAAAKPAVAVPQGKKSAAASDAGRGASPAAALIATIKSKDLPDADRRLAEARKIVGIKLNLNAIAAQLIAARRSLASAERDLARKPQAALEEATAVQRQVRAFMDQIEAATKSAKQTPATGPTKK